MLQLRYLIVWLAFLYSLFYFQPCSWECLFSRAIPCPRTLHPHLPCAFDISYLCQDFVVNQLARLFALLSAATHLGSFFFNTPTHLGEFIFRRKPHLHTLHHAMSRASGVTDGASLPSHDLAVTHFARRFHFVQVIPALPRRQWDHELRFKKAFEVIHRSNWECSFSEGLFPQHYDMGCPFDAFDDVLHTCHKVAVTPLPRLFCFLFFWFFSPHRSEAIALIKKDDPQRCSVHIQVIHKTQSRVLISESPTNPPTLHREVIHKTQLRVFVFWVAHPPSHPAPWRDPETNWECSFSWPSSRSTWNSILGVFLNAFDGVRFSSALRYDPACVFGAIGDVCQPCSHSPSSPVLRFFSFLATTLKRPRW